MTRFLTALARSVALLAVLLLGACAPAERVVRPPEAAEIARIDSVLAMNPPRPLADSLAAERSRLVVQRDQRLSVATLIAAGVAVLPAVAYIVVRDLNRPE